MCVLLIPNHVLYLWKIFKKFVMSFHKMQLFLVLALRQSIPVKNWKASVGPGEYKYMLFMPGRPKLGYLYDIF